MKFLVLVGRILYSLMFIMAGKFHFSEAAVGYASAQGVPFPEITVKLAGVMAVLGGLSVAFGFKAKWGAWLIVLFLIPVTAMMHQFWNVSDPMMAGIQTAMFFKNLSMLGAALCITQVGSGPYSWDSRKH